MVAVLKLHLQRSKWVLALLIKSEIRNQIDKTNNLLLTIHATNLKSEVIQLVFFMCGQSPMEVSIVKMFWFTEHTLWIALTPPSCLITGITGDGRCLFRSVAYGACLRRGKHPPSDSAQKELADELRAKVSVHHLGFWLLSAPLFDAFQQNSENVTRCALLIFPPICIVVNPLLCLFQVADEFVKRRGDTEWFHPLSIITFLIY
jgi:hypothetical protein